ncbi:MAG TPA: FAD/NAD(P)-binding protein, partial [Steroidobacteraceae bacterium]
MTHPPRTLVIVGAGFSGTAVAINLLRLSYWKPVRIVLVERAEHMARGAAYADKGYPYLLNVPAGRMSLNSGDPLDFLKFARQRKPAATADDFLPRSLYGEYLEEALRTAELASPPHVQLTRIRGDVCSVERVGNKRSLRVELKDGSSFIADDVVLALGNPPPAHLRGTEQLRNSARYVADPWSSPPKFEQGETALIIGTGLSMADAVIAGNEATFHAISRRGLVPPSQTAFRQAGCDDDGDKLIRAAALSARRLLRAVRELTDEVQSRGGDWREAITCVRNLAPAIWQRLSQQERQRFLRHARPYWDVHRYRLPQ